ncbi:hypothetical protein CHELA40_20003 [Chelatococcus asaccharovorans]|nr:hypothetical protein CHELA17_10061 [Chelatococcus asaccharovorans]CAH1687123.1 hypothetical protein CHELA40_20003 [Chelatococcus asaccharovorans]
MGQHEEKAAQRPPGDQGKVGSVNRPAAAVRIVFEEDFDVGTIELVGRQDAEFVVDLEEDDRGHEGAGEVPGSLLSEGEIVGHPRLHLGAGQFPLDGSVSVRGRSRSPRRRRQAAAAC